MTRIMLLIAWLALMWGALHVWGIFTGGVDDDY